MEYWRQPRLPWCILFEAHWPRGTETLSEMAQQLVGIVIGTRMMKTAKVEVTRMVLHPHVIKVRPLLLPRPRYLITYRVELEVCVHRPRKTVEAFTYFYSYSTSYSTAAVLLYCSIPQYTSLAFSLHTCLWIVYSTSGDSGSTSAMTRRRGVGWGTWWWSNSTRTSARGSTLRWSRFWRRAPPTWPRSSSSSSRVLVQTHSLVMLVLAAAAHDTYTSYL